MQVLLLLLCLGQASVVSPKPLAVDAQPFSGQRGVRRVLVGKIATIPISIGLPKPGADGFLTITDFDGALQEMSFRLDIPEDLHTGHFNEMQKSTPGHVLSWSFWDHSGSGVWVLDLAWRLEGDSNLPNAAKDKVLYLRIRERK